MLLKVYHIALIVMSVLAVVVFFALLKIDAGYGKFYSKKWGKSVSNKVGWKIMEAPVFIIMLALWAFSEYRFDIGRICILLLFQIHYFYRAFIFPNKFKGRSQMAISVVAMGFVFQVINALLIGGWLFYLSPPDYYGASWLLSYKFIIGLIIFVVGMVINRHSDNVILNLRKTDENKYYLPTKGLYRYVTSANYFGELVEWIGFAILSWSGAAAVFALWTFANLTPRAIRIYDKYVSMFPDEMKNRKLKKLIPFIF